VTESFQTAAGRTLTYRREGDGPLLVCHPGGPGFSSLYFADLASLGAAFTLILLNPRGTADSDRPDDVRAYTTSDYVADVEELRAHLGADQLDLLGHSHGGVVAMAYAAEHPDRVRRLIAANSLVRIRRDEMEPAMESRSAEPWYADAREALEQEDAGAYATEEELAALTRRFFPFYFAHFDEKARAYLDEHVASERPNPDALKLFNDGIEKWDMRPDLARIAAPTLVITGEADFITGPECAQDIGGGIAGARVVIVEDCGHFTFIEHPDRFRAEVTRFLS
jgi:Predicted hydrolases or acyltransferases (alpha/beta hydrolase superfamily)